MSIRYDLPKTSNSKGSFVQTFLIWGLPVICWLGLIIAWWLYSGEEEPSEKKPEATSQVAPAPTETATEPVSQESPKAPETPVAPQPEQPLQPSMPAAPQPVESTNAPAPAPTTPVNAVAQLPGISSIYDFSGARSNLNLPKENLCKSGIIVDPVTHKVLWAKNAEKVVPIASMTKMMTLLLIEEAITNGSIKRDTVIPVTEKAYRIGGTQVWLDPRESFPLRELMKAIAIRSANDAAFLVGEYLSSGDITSFIRLMNGRAKELGMANTHFFDAHGLGDKKAKKHNTSSAYDMILLAEKLLNYPEVMKLVSTRLDTFRNGKTELRNSNNLVFNRIPGVDGMKTGFTDEAGYCVTFTCIRNGRRLIGCVTGFDKSKNRDEFCKALLDWAYRAE